MNTLQLAKYKQHLLQEIGGEKGKAKRYNIKTLFDNEENRVYAFETDSKLYYLVELEEFDDEDHGTILNVEFGVANDKNRVDMGSNQNVVTNKGELYRVMNTVAAIIKEDLYNNSHIEYITFSAAKRDKDVDTNARNNVYMKYIQGRLPKAEIVKDPEYGILIKTNLFS